MKDTEIWNELCGGQKSALKRIYDRYAHDLLLYGCKLCRDRTMVEDALQEIFIHCWEKRATLPEVNNIRSYLFTAIRRKLYRELANSPPWRSLDGEASLKREMSIPFDPMITVNESAFGDTAEQKKLMVEVRKMIAQLSERQREIVYLKYIEGMDYEEITQIMGLSYQSSRNLLSKALKNLRNLNI